jgi:hypothetical protein
MPRSLEIETRRESGGSVYWIQRGFGPHSFLLVGGGRVFAGPYPTLEIAMAALDQVAPRSNPMRKQLRQRYHVTEETMVGEGGQLVEPLSESGELTFAIELLNDAMARGLPAGARHDVAVAVGTLRRLKEQVMHGYHRNPEPSQRGGIHIDIASHSPARISRRIGQLIREGRPDGHGQAAAIAYSEARRRRNPPMVVLGANPAGNVLRAKWAKIEYCRPDDPAGKRVARVHDFPDGFVAHGLADGSVLLRHPKGRRLWTRS